MNTVRKDIDAINAKIIVNIGESDYSAKVDEKLRDYKKKANIPGFRPGNIPLGMLKKMYGKAIKAEVINELTAEGLYNYIRENEINVLGEPLPSEDQKPWDFDDDTDFEFSFDIALAPEFSIDFTADDKVKYYDITVSDEMIDNQIKSYTSRFGTYNEEDTVEPKDMVKGELLEMKDGEINPDGVKMPDGVLTPDYMKDDAQKTLFVNAKKGSKIIFNPYKAFGGNLAELSSLLKINKEEAEKLHSDFQMEISSITRYHESEINQELFDKVFGEGKIKSEAEFKDKIISDIKESLTADGDYRFGIDAKDMVLNKLKNVVFPDVFLKRWLLATQEGMTEEKLATDYSKMIKDVTWHLAKEKMVTKYGIKVETADVENYARKVARAQFAQYGMVGMEDSLLDNYVQDMMKKEDHVRQFAESALEDKVLEAMKNDVTLDKTEISIDDFNKLFDAQ